ncbi:flagellar basal-body MS-ring/collar protein FliF [Desulfopila sp. IMCC35006]|uniref:flagellar basal-body MS-ring/collar protein FliF n=1 Tax=Desulfopila sp. IMCC35006 TaxID=2569542 RepID=UPI001F0D4EB4|nr:flagellar basal-body MS-ring/collar protein FliF [Desulfopila sp. IMCC35006]
MEKQEMGIATSPQSNPPDIIRPQKKNVFGLVQEWPLSKKISTGAVLLISMVLFAFLIIQARTADQQLLYANLALQDASSVTAWLKNQKIDYSLKNGGKDIWVPADRIYQTRLDLAANGLPTGGDVGFEIFDKQNFALTDYVQKVNYTRALQGELARTISSLAPVESTRVHLALPEKRLFKNQQKDGTASVIVTLVTGQNLDQEQVQGIINLVAGSVTGLEPDNVKIIDSNGVVLKGQKKAPENEMLSADMLAFQQEVEHRMEIRAQDLLDKTMGADNAMVRVSATLDFSKVEKTQESFDGDDPVIRSEQVSAESSGAATTGGVPGVQSNLQGNAAGSGQSATASPTNKNTRTTNYEISKTISKVVNPVGNVTALSVSVLVADKVKVDADGKVESATPRTAEELKSIENMVASAIGLMPQRGDVINVLSMPFVDTQKASMESEQAPADLLYKYMPLIKYAMIGLGMLLVYFLLVRPIIKNMKSEVQQHNKTVKQLEMEQRRLLEREPVEPPPPVDDAITALRREVQQNQVPTAFILKNWIQEG